MQPHAQDFHEEFQNLLTLQLLRHPNIVRLLGCYTFRNATNFIFPKADGGDLHELLRNPRPNTFADGNAFLLALTGLASAVAAVHIFVVEELPLALIGCHHDVKAGNILVDKGQFILSDFGLARFKSGAEGSTTPYKVRKGFSVAPECQALGKDLEKGLVHRSSDIWSFGCVMLDVVTYMLRGPESVTTFDNEREFAIEQFYYSYYHKGTEPHHVVTNWMEELRREGSDAEKLLIDLIRQMLQIEPNARPTAGDVEASIVRITLFSMSKAVVALFDKLDGSSLSELSVNPWVEKKRFESWMMALELHDSSSVGTGPRIGFERFRALSLDLGTLTQELTTILSCVQNTSRRILLPLRRLNTRLYEQLPPELKMEAQAISEILLLRTDYLTQIGAIHSGEKTANLTTISRLARSKYESQIAKKTWSTSVGLELPKPEILHTKFGHHGLGILTVDKGHAIKVLVEFKHYDDPASGSELYPRMKEITKTYKAFEEGESFGLLNCRGFFHDETQRHYGLVYDLPFQNVGEQEPSHPRLKTLLDVLSPKVEPPSLVYRYKLAHSLAAAISSVHKVGWVHKGLMSSNVLVSMTSESTITSSQRPFIMGFRHSRPNVSGIFTEGPAFDEDAEYYQHPSYLEVEGSYRLQYDYYSLGILLLEVGHWRPLRELADLKKLNPVEVSAKLLNRRVPLLEHLMGNVYRSIVDVCLGDSFGSPQHLVAARDNQREHDDKIQLQFEHKVLSKLLALSRLVV